ncbi:MAG: M23 family peptidase, partial [Actinomycetota bacterium]
MLRRLGCLVLIGIAWSAGPVAAATAPALRPPVYGAIERGFEAPQKTYGPGHRGVDLAAPPGTHVAA